MFRIALSHDGGLTWRTLATVDNPVAIEVTYDGGESWQTIAGRVLTTGSQTSSFHWGVGNAVIGSARLRVRALDGSGAVGVSEVFRVASGSTLGPWSWYGWSSLIAVLLVSAAAIWAFRTAVGERALAVST